MKYYSYEAAYSFIFLQRTGYEFIQINNLSKIISTIQII